ncbi:MAG: hypothetical protein WC091_17880 [Sulfuricellaceae bacterium]
MSPLLLVFEIERGNLRHRRAFRRQKATHLYAAGNNRYVGDAARAGVFGVNITMKAYFFRLGKSASVKCRHGYFFKFQLFRQTVQNITFAPDTAAFCRVHLKGIVDYLRNKCKCCMREGKFVLSTEKPIHRRGRGGKPSCSSSASSASSAVKKGFVFILTRTSRNQKTYSREAAKNAKKNQGRFGFFRGFA